MRNQFVFCLALASLLLAPAASADEQEFVTGDGVAFRLAVNDGLPARAEDENAVFEAAGFDTDTSAALTITDRFTFALKSGDLPVRVRVEDVTSATPVLLVEASVPDDLPGAGFRRSLFEMRAEPCAIARGESCSAWMFGDQTHRLYRATLVYADGTQVTLLQAEPYAMGGFIARLGDRVPNASTDADQTAQSERP